LKNGGIWICLNSIFFLEKSYNLKGSLLFSEIKSIVLTNSFYAWTIDLILKQINSTVALKGFLDSQTLENSYKVISDAFAEAKKRMVKITEFAFFFFFFFGFGFVLFICLLVWFGLFFLFVFFPQKK
jgi:hypothetical protein